ncbi:M23 family metallopeptidase [Streptomyces sp. NPDC088725]|uniref:M23 family metallopeptidase n=1 Tax=Streptomyces sp. NPDC088725 TaxID=3365873 RepID=UPI003803B484
MSQPTQPRQSRRSVLRSRAAILAAGVGVSVAAGTGAAFAATGSDASAHLGEAASSSTVVAVQKQASAQSEAAQKHAAAVKAQHAKLVQQEKDRKVQLVAEQIKAKKTAAKKAASWIPPVDHYKLSAPFGRGGTMWSHKHSGQDFAVPIGTAVHAAHGGTVVKAGPNGAGDGPAYGNAVVIRHANNTYSQYAHLSKVEVHVGQHVNTDQFIALSGNTGNSSGPHLHFEIRTTPNYGSAVNPVHYMRAEGVKL